MKYMLILLLLVGCAGEPLTEDEIFEKEYEEAVRKEAYVRWEKSCLAAKGIIFVYKASRPHRRGQVPREWDWKYNHEKERPALGNAYQCVSKNEAMKRINF